MICSHPWPLAAILFIAMALVMGGLLWTGQVYRGLVIADHQHLLQSSLRHETDDAIEQMTVLVSDIADHLRRSTVLQTATDAAALSDVLNDQFQSYPVSSGLIDLVQLYLFDSDYALLAYSTAGPSASNARGVYCQSFVDRARQQGVTDKSGFCRVGSRPFYALTTALEHHGDIAHVLIVVDPLANLIELERHLGFPLMFYYSEDEVGYRSPVWQPEREAQGLIEAQVPLSDDLGDTILVVATQKDIAPELAQSQAINRYIWLAVATLIVVVTMSTAYIARCALRRPLRAIATHLHTARDSRAPLALPKEIEGHPDMQPLVEALKRVDDDLAYLRAHHQTATVVDHLTALPNRVLFKDRLGQLMESCRRRGERFALLLLDVDGFRGINSSLGHQVGDRVLSYIAERLLATLRASSTVARISEEAAPLYLKAEGSESVAQSMRMGGDEFSLLLPGVESRDDAMSVARRIGDALALPIAIDGQSVMVTASLGVALYPNHGENADTLLSHGYAALSEAKATGCGVLIYRELHDVHLTQHQTLQAELGTAIQCDQLRVVYQPKFELASGSVVAVEALVRWDHPQHGEMLPEQFVSLAEQRGLIHALTDCVLRQALAQFKTWRAQGITWPVALNISSRILYDSQFPENLKRMLDDHDLAVSAVTLDINEQAIIIDPHRALAAMERLDKLGIAMSIDDFGTGYSSLGFLKNLPVREIKIDNTFVMDMKRAGNDANIVHATIDLAHNLGLKVVAEGVDDDATLAVLKSLNCDYGQGFAIGPPMTPEALLDWVQQSESSGAPS